MTMVDEEVVNRLMLRHEERRARFFLQHAFDEWIVPARQRARQRLRGVELMRKVRRAWPIWATMHAQGRVRALPHEATRIQRREAMRRTLKTKRQRENRLDAYLTNMTMGFVARDTNEMIQMRRW